MDKQNYTYIEFNRTDLFEVCKLGFMASRIGSLWCSGYMLTERLWQLEQSGVTFEKVS